MFKNKQKYIKNIGLLVSPFVVLCKNKKIAIGLIQDNNTKLVIKISGRFSTIIFSSEKIAEGLIF